MAMATLDDAPGDDHIDPGQAPCVTHCQHAGFLDRQSFKVRISSFNSGAVRVAHKAVIQAHVEEAFAAGTAG
jgi:hypothetical protein